MSSKPPAPTGEKPGGPEGDIATGGRRLGSLRRYQHCLLLFEQSCSLLIVERFLFPTTPIPWTNSDIPFERRNYTSN